MYYLTEIRKDYTRLHHIIASNGERVHSVYDIRFGLIGIDEYNFKTFGIYDRVKSYDDFELGEIVTYDGKNFTIIGLLIRDSEFYALLNEYLVVPTKDLIKTHMPFMRIGSRLVFDGQEYMFIGYKDDKTYVCVGKNGIEYLPAGNDYEYGDEFDGHYCMYCQRLEYGDCPNNGSQCSCGVHKSSSAIYCDLCLLNNKLHSDGSKPCSICGELTTHTICGGDYICYNCLSKLEYRRCFVCGLDTIDFKYIVDEGAFIGASCGKNTKIYYCKRCDMHFFRYCECRIPKKSYNYKPPMHNFLKLPSDNTNLYVGVEIEIDGSSGSQSALCNGILEHYPGHFYFKHDGSLSTNGIEMPSHPMTPNFFRAMNWKKVFDIIAYSGYDDIRKTGLHFHLSRKHFTQEEIAKLVFLVDYYYNTEILRVSRRSEDDMRTWALRAYSRNYSSSTKYLNYVYINGGEHHSAVNITNDNSVELRFFKGTYDYVEFMESFEFVMKLVDIVKTKTWDELKTCFKKGGE